MLENCAEKLNSLLHAHAQSIRRRLNSYNFAAGLDDNYLQPQSIRSDSIVSTTAEFFVWTKKTRFQAGWLAATEKSSSCSFTMASLHI
jgi:hypothetical protein